MCIMKIKWILFSDDFKIWIKNKKNPNFFLSKYS